MRHSGKNLSSLRVPRILGRKAILIPMVDTRGICCYEVLAENGTVQSVISRLMCSWHSNQRHAMWLLDDSARVRRYA